MPASNEKQHIHNFFAAKNYIELYLTQTATIREMLRIEIQQEFEDFLKDEDFLEEKPFWLYYSVVNGESLLIGGYDEDGTEKVAAYLKRNLPETLFCCIDEHLQDIYVDFGTRDTLEEKN